MQNTAQLAYKLKAGKSNDDNIQFADDYSDSCAKSLNTSEVNEKQVCLLKRDDYNINIVDSLKQRLKTSSFIQSIYASCGYLTESSTTFTSNPKQITFEATRDQQILGTLTLTIDSEGQNLLADTLYKKEIDSFRSKDRKICEVSKLVFKKNSGSKKMLAELFHLAYIYAHFLHEATDAVIEVNPRHASFYKRMLGFRQISEQLICPRVNAPAVLLCLEHEKINKQLLSTIRSEKCYGKSIYPYFLSQLEGKELLNNLMITKKFHSVMAWPAS